MGGIDSGVQPDTAALFLECAYFSPEAIAGCARKYAMHTESAHRFERGVDPELQMRAMERATRLLLEICGGNPGPVVEVSDSGQLPGSASILLRRARLQQVLGMSPEPQEVTDILTRLGMAVTAQGEDWLVHSPTFRFDIRIEADLIEEVGRIHGYNRLPSVAMQGALDVLPLPETEQSLEQLCDLLVARGYQEAVTYSFIDPGLQSSVNPSLQPVRLANPISSEMSEMRTSLWPGLIKAVQYNLNRQKSRLRLFEHGLRFYTQDNEIKQEVMLSGIITGTRLPEHWGGKAEAVDFYDIKHDVEMLLHFAMHPDEPVFVAAEHPALHPGQSAQIQCAGRTLGWLGKIHPALADSYDLDANTCLFELRYAAIRQGTLARFEPISRYPSIRRDLAFVVDAGTTAAELRRVVADAAGELLQELVFFDVYQGKGVETGRKSIAFGLILQDYSRTLTEQEIEAIVARVTGRLHDEFGATLRA
jgi:phenylalanyl-tRNA synthetase beta chain